MRTLKLLVYGTKFLFKHIKDYNQLKKQYDQQKMDQIMIEFCEGVLDTIDVTYEIIDNRRYIPENALYISNHNSMYDSVLSALAVKERHSYFIAGEFENNLNYPIVGNVHRFIHSIFIDRSNLRAGLKAITQGTKNLNAGLNLVIFAEGEITKYVIKDDQQYVADFHAGSFKPALSAGKPIVPITIIGSDKVHNTLNMWSKLTPGHVKIIIGDVIDIHLDGNNHTTVEMADYTRQVIVDNYIAYSGEVE